MAKIAFGMGVAFGVQSDFGSVNTTIRDLTGSLTTASGIVLGDGETGIGNTGIDIGFGNEKRATPDVSGSFTKQFHTFLRETIETFDFTMQLKGLGPAGQSGLASATPTDTDANIATNFPGLNALFRACGLSGSAWGSGVGHQLIPAAVLPITAKLWFGTSTTTVAVVLRDLVADLDLVFTPGEVCLATFKMRGNFHSRSKSETFPTFTYGLQTSISAPTIESVAHSWGIGAAARGFSEGTIAITNGLDDVPDSNQATGKIPDQTEREITADWSLYLDDGDESYDFDRVGASTATTDDMGFTVGTPMVDNTSEVKAFRIGFSNPDHLSAEPIKIGGRAGAKVSARATGTSVNSEFTLTFL
jgi:hypothetical protein